MFEQSFKNIDDILHKDAGCTSELDYTEQSSWLLVVPVVPRWEHVPMNPRRSLIPADPLRRGGRRCVYALRISVGDVRGWLRGRWPSSWLYAS